ncbi:MAG: hypothetical protein IKD36_02620 [Clostridia bacterium]|nr:hypothetical protein [Clostridia bacterium]
MINEKILTKSIAVIGPKQVGKTFVCENLAQEKNMPNFVLSSDLLTNLIVFNMAGKWHDLVETTELKEVGELYKKTFNFKELEPIVQSLANCNNVAYLSPKAKKVAMSYWKARLLEDATDMLKEPYILDAGADIGAIYNLSSDDQLFVSQAFYLPYDLIESRLPRFLNQFGMITYLKPGKTYESLEGRAKDDENALYLESGKSYQPFASYTIDCDELYATEKPKEITVKKETQDIANKFNQQTFGE